MNRHISTIGVGRRQILAAACLALALFSGQVDAQQAAKTREIEVAICLDVSSSMDGLVASAKQKLWDVVNGLARAKPMPILRVAVYSYGNNAYDPKTGWVRQEIELTTDLDQVSAKLFALQATKKPNSEEYVGRVCRDAVEKLKWSSTAGALKVIFVCGNESAEQDPEVKLTTVAEAAVRKNIIINTIFCGPPTDPVAPGWKQFALLSEGRFAAIDQDRGTVTVSTPMDKELAELSAKLNTTFCFAGKDGKALAANQRLQDDNALRLGGAAAASRAESKASDLYRFEGHDLVDKLKRDAKFDVKKLPTEELPENLRKMKPEEREQYVRDLLARREALQKQIGELSKKREAYIQEELKKKPQEADRAFDAAVRGALREQAQKKGIEIPK